MATSGSFNTGTVGSFYFSYEWSRIGYDSSRNEHYIHYTLYAHNTPGNYRTVYLKNLWVAGTQVFYEAGTSGNGKVYYDGNVVTSGDITIASSNSAGDGSFGASFEAGVGSYPSSNCSGSSSWNLDRIPRYANITSFSVSKRDETSVKFNYSVDASCDYAWYSTDNGGSWHDLPNSNIVGGLSANTGYNFKLRLRRTDSQLTTESGTYTQSTYDYPKPTSVSSASIGDPFTVYVDNPLGRTYTLQLISNNSNSVIGSYVGSINGNVIGFNVSEIDLMYASIPNSNSGTYYAKVTYGSSVKTKGTGTYTTKASVCNPTFSNCTYEDVKEESLLLTGDSSILINNYNTLKVTISTANKAVANKSATMSRYRLVCGNKSVEANYSSNSNVTLTLENITNIQFTVYAIDSRENSTAVTKSVSEWKDYTNPVISSATVSRTGGVSKETTLAFSGIFWKTEEQYDFGAVANEIIECSYRYKKSNESSYGNSVDITPTISNENISFSSTIRGDAGAEGFNLTNIYDIQITIKDKIKIAIYNVLLGTGNPSMAVAPRWGIVWCTL